MVCCIRCGCRELVLTGREEIPSSGRLPEGEVPGGRSVPAEGDELVLTGREEFPSRGGLPEGEMPGGRGVPVGGDILKIDRPDGYPSSGGSPRGVEVLCFAEEGRGLNSEHKCPSKNRSLEEEEEMKEERVDLGASSLNSALA